MTSILRLFPLRVWIAIAILALVLGYCAVTRPSRDATRKAEAGQAFEKGRTGAAQDASAVRDRSEERDDQITQAVKEGTSNVRQAPDRSAATLAARRGVCRVNASAGPDCRMLLADPGRVD